MQTTARAYPAFWDMTSLRQRLDADASPLQIAVVCAFASMLSLLFTGSVFGLDNHVFHIPIIHRLYEEDQFRDDVFIQSLRFYSSGLWLLLAGSERYAGDGHLLFHGLLYLSRLLAFVGLVCCASLMGIRTLRQRIIFCFILCFATILNGTSLAGHGAMFVMTFGHSEVANGTILLAIYFGVRAQIAKACLFAGLTFFINAFMGVWLVLPLAGIAASLLWKRRISIRKLLVQGAWGGMAYAIVAFPVVYNILSNPDFGKSVGFDYSTYLREYYGSHFFVGSNAFYETCLLAVLAALGWLALSRLKQHEVELKAALVGMTALYGAGIFIPLLTSSPTILNLHLLRSGVMIHLLAAICAGALATKWLSSSDKQEATVLGPYLLFFLFIPYMFTLAVILLAFEANVRNRAKASDHGFRATVFLVLLLVVIPWQGWQNYKARSAATSAVGEWETVGRWAQSSTPPEAVFLVTAIGSDGSAGASPAQQLQSEALAAASSVFEGASHRRIWVDFKRGAAVMWRPSYHKDWRSRIDAVLQLKSLSETLSFARTEGIDYVMGDCRAFRSSQIVALFSTKSLCVGAAAKASGVRAVLNPQQDPLEH